MPTATKLITAEELFEMGDVGPCELVRGEIVPMVPPGFEHGEVAGQLFFLISAFVRKKKLGRVVAAETGFTIARNPDTTRGADVAFVSKGRLPKRKLTSYFEGSPDLAIEVISPSDRASEIATKIEEWLAGGAVSVWVVDPRTQSIQIYRKRRQVLRFVKGEMIDDEPTLPGFSLKVDEAFKVD